MLESSLAFFTRILTGVTVRYVTDEVFHGSRVYIANHASNLDFLVIWSVLPGRQRVRTVPVAALDYWDRGPFRRFAAREVFHAQLVHRGTSASNRQALEAMLQVLAREESLIVFPEGTRSLDGTMREFKPGIHFLARRAPGVTFVPVWLENLNRILPKGEFLPVPLACSATFGRPLRLESEESRGDFLARAEQAVRDLAGSSHVL